MKALDHVGDTVKKKLIDDSFQLLHDLVNIAQLATLKAAGVGEEEHHLQPVIEQPKIDKQEDKTKRI